MIALRKNLEVTVNQENNGSFKKIGEQSETDQFILKIGLTLQANWGLIRNTSIHPKMVLNWNFTFAFDKIFVLHMMGSYSCVYVEGFSIMYTLVRVPKKGFKYGVKRRTNQGVALS